MVGAKATAYGGGGNPIPRIKSLVTQSGITPYRPASMNYPDEYLFQEGSDTITTWWTEKQEGKLPEGAKITGSQVVPADQNHPEKTVYLVEKRFQQLQVVAEHAASAITTFLKSEEVVVLGPTGFSNLSPQLLKEMGLAEGDYEEATACYITTVISSLVSYFPNVHFVIADGASDAFVDKGACMAAERLQELGVDHIGHTCNRYLRYVKDRPGVVQISPSSEEYANAFVNHVDILLGLGGRAHALKLDIRGVMSQESKLLVLPDLIRTISAYGDHLPSHSKGELADASAMFGTLLRLVPPQGTAFDPLQAVAESTAKNCIDVSRRALPASKKFGHQKPWLIDK